MALIAPSPRPVLRAREAPAMQPHAAACSTVAGGGGAAGRPLGMWSGGGGKGRRRERGDGMLRAEAYFWDVSKPVEMEEIDSMEKLDDALRWSVENKQPIIIDWFYFVDVNKVPQTVVKRGNITSDPNTYLIPSQFLSPRVWMHLYIQKMPTIQLWKDGEWAAEVIGGHKAWLVMDEVREMIQKHK
uniref:Thioredoxin domain-containing protein n=1 Tax=Oryza meridionalis TaxID=40149 RepID=A0A0E0CS47_9ORYZ